MASPGVGGTQQSQKVCRSVRRKIQVAKPVGVTEAQASPKQGSEPPLGKVSKADGGAVWVAPATLEMGKVGDIPQDSWRRLVECRKDRP